MEETRENDGEKFRAIRGCNLPLENYRSEISLLVERSKAA
jgi:hypothetical protein